MLDKAKATFHSVVSRYKLSTVLVALILFWVPIIAFGSLAGEVLEREPIEEDIAILQAIHGITTPFLDAFFLFVTNSGSAVMLSAISILIIGYFISTKRWKFAAILAFGVGGAVIANLILKLLFQRDRPDLWVSMVIEHSHSFPSGHAMATSAFAASLILISWHTRWRWWVVGLGVVFAFLVGFSRLYFGVHYPTDVVAGWCVSAVWVVIAASLIGNFPFMLRTRVARLLKKS